MRSLLTKYRYTQRLARSTKRDTSRPFYGQEAPSLYHYRLSPINQQPHKVFSVTFLLLWFRGARIHTVDKMKEQGKKEKPQLDKNCSLVVHSGVMDVQLRELGWKIKSRGLLKGKGTFFRDIFHVKNRWPVDLWPCTENVGIQSISEAVWSLYSVLQRSTGCKAPIHIIPSSFFLLIFAADTRNSLSRVSQYKEQCLFSLGVSLFKYAPVLMTEGCFIWIYVEQIVSLLCKAHLHPPLHKRVQRCAGWVQTGPR